LEICPLKLLNEIYAKKLETIFINTPIALRIFENLPITGFEAERAFTKLGNQLKFIKANQSAKNDLIPLHFYQMKFSKN